MSAFSLSLREINLLFPKNQQYTGVMQTSHGRCIATLHPSIEIQNKLQPLYFFHIFKKIIFHSGKRPKIELFGGWGSVLKNFDM